MIWSLKELSTVYRRGKKKGNQGPRRDSCGDADGVVQGEEIRLGSWPCGCGMGQVLVSEMTPSTRYGIRAQSSGGKVGEQREGASLVHLQQADLCGLHLTLLLWLPRLCSLCEFLLCPRYWLFSLVASCPKLALLPYAIPFLSG